MCLEGERERWAKAAALTSVSILYGGVRKEKRNEIHYERNGNIEGSLERAKNINIFPKEKNYE